MLSSLDVVVAALLSPSSTFENDVAFALLCSVDACVVLPNALVMVTLLLLLLCDFVELPKLMSELSTHTHTRTHAVTLRVKPSSKVRSLVCLRCALSSTYTALSRLSFVSLSCRPKAAAPKTIEATVVVVVVDVDVSVHFQRAFHAVLFLVVCRCPFCVVVVADAAFNCCFNCASADSLRTHNFIYNNIV